MLFIGKKLKIRSKLVFVKTIFFNGTDDSLMAVQGNSHQLFESSNLCYDFDTNMNKTFELNESNEHSNVTGSIKANLEPFNKLTTDYSNQKTNVPLKLSEIESDDSLGLLPDLINEEITLDFFKSGALFSDNDIHDVLDSEINENPPACVFSPPCNNQFDRISMFLKNVSTPLPNFTNYRRNSSTPKFLSAAKFEVNASNIVQPDSLPNSFVEKDEDHIIAGSCRMEFKSDFNLDDFENVKHLASTCKAFVPETSVVLNELIDESGLKSKVNFLETSDSYKNNLNVTQTFSKDENIFSHEYENSFKDVNVLNNTFKIRPSVHAKSPDAIVQFKPSIPSTLKINELSNSCNEKEMVQILNSTFEIPGNEIGYLEKTFVIDFNSSVRSKVSPKTVYEERMLNETRVIELDSIELLSKQQEQIANVTFTKESGNDSIDEENYYYNSQGLAFKPMNPIFEETFSENDLNEMQAHANNAHLYIKHESQSAAEKLNVNTTFLENVAENLPEKRTQNDNYLFEFDSSNIMSEVKENCFDNIILAGTSKTHSEKMLLSNALQSIGNHMSFEKKIERHKVDEFHESGSIENDNSSIEHISSKTLESFTVNEQMGEKKYFNQNNLVKEGNVTANEASHLNALLSNDNSIFSEKTNKRSDQGISKFIRRYSFPAKNSSELASNILSKTRKQVSDRTEETNFESKVLKNSNNLIEKGTSNSQPISRISYSLSLNQMNSSDTEDNLSEVIKDVFTSNPSEESTSDIKDNFSEVIEEVFTSNPSEESTSDIKGNISEMIEDVFTSNPSEEITSSARIENCSLEMLSKSSNKVINATFSEKACELENSISSDKDVQSSLKSLGEMSNGVLSEKNGEVGMDLYSVLKVEFQSSLNSLKETTNVPSKSTDVDIKVKHKIYFNQYKSNSVDEITSSNITNLSSKDNFSANVDKNNSSIKGSSCESKPVKNRLIKPTRIVRPRIASEQCSSHSPVTKPLRKSTIHKSPIPSDFNQTLILSDNKADKSFSKDLNRKYSLPCSSTRGDNKSKYKNDFKKPFEMSPKPGIKKPTSNYQKPRPDLKYSNGHSKNIVSLHKQNMLPHLNLVSDNPKNAKSTIAVYRKKEPGSCRSSLKPPIKPFKRKECDLKTNIAVADTSKEIIPCSKIVEQSKKEKMPEIKINKANLGNNVKSSIATILPRRLPTSSNVISSKISIIKSPATKQKIAPSVRPYKLDSVQIPDTRKLPKSINMMKFSSVPKVQSSMKISSNGNNVKRVVNTMLSPGIKKSKGEAVQFVKTHISAGHTKLKENIRGNTQVSSSIDPTSSKQVLQPSNTLNRRNTLGNIPLFRRLPAPVYKK